MGVAQQLVANVVSRSWPSYPQLNSKPPDVGLNSRHGAQTGIPGSDDLSGEWRVESLEHQHSTQWENGMLKDLLCFG